MISNFRKKSNSPPAKPMSFRALRTLQGLLLLALLTPSAAMPTLRTQAYLTTSTVNPRPMSMGGAFVTVQDDLAALIWNPAAFTLYETEVSHRLCVHVNPVIPVLLLRKDHRHVADFLAALSLAIKGVTFSHRWAEIGLLLWEEPFYNPAASVNGRFFDTEHILKHYSHTLGLRIRLAPTVSLGSTGNVYRIRNEEGKSVLAGGVNYGVLLKPVKGLTVGLAYFDFPSSLKQLRGEMEGIVDGSITAGFSLHPDDRTIVAMDLRDASGLEKLTWNKLHFGFERTFWEHLALRFGYFQAGHQEHDVYSLGIGLVGRNGRERGAARRSHSSYLANYALLVEEGKQNQRLWHMLSVLFCI